ncbi:MAG: CoA transferase, partial [Deltaproteobacteria bacterium]
RPLVVDLSALWAGPLCAHLLGLAGARVIKVESTGRPDGARGGPAAFYDLLNAGKESVALDFRNTDHLRVLERLIERADVVVEASRPRALEQLGIDAEHVVRSRPGLVWVSITGYGRDEPMRNWCAFGDDAAAAGGLVAGSTDRPLFCSDAIADPLTGMHAAAAAVAAWRTGRACLLDVAMARVAAYVAAFDTQPQSVGGGRNVPAKENEYDARRAGAEPPEAGQPTRVAVARPRARKPAGRARPMGVDTKAIARELEQAGVRRC